MWKAADAGGSDVTLPAQHIPAPALGKASSVQGAEGQRGAALGGLSAVQGGPAPARAPLAWAVPSPEQEPSAGSAAARPRLSLHGPGDIAPGSASPRGPPVLPSHAPSTASWLHSSPAACPRVPLCLAESLEGLRGGGNIPAMSGQF